jgi:hypothetical protein
MCRAGSSIETHVNVAIDETGKNGLAGHVDALRWNGLGWCAGSDIPNDRTVDPHVPCLVNTPGAVDDLRAAQQHVHLDPPGDSFETAAFTPRYG